MRVLILTQYFWPEEFIVNDFAIGLQERGHDVSVLTGLPNYPSGSFFQGYGFTGPYRENYQGIPIYRAPLIPRGNSKGGRLVVNYLSFALSACVRGLFHSRAYDAIFVFEVSPITIGIPARFLRWLTRASLYFWVLDLWPESLSATGAVRSKRALTTVGELTKWVYRGCDRILIASDAFRDSVCKYGANPSKVAYFPNWAEACFTRISVPSDTPECSLMPRGFRIMFAGNVGISQDFGTILSAAEATAQRNPDVQWVIVGDGRNRDWVAEEIERRGLGNVHLLGRHPKSNMPVFFSLADVMLVSLKREPIFELTVPAKVQAYLACGKPILASLKGEGARIIEESGAGIAVSPEGPEGLANAACRLAEMDHDELTEMGDRARRYYEQHFDVELLMSRFESWMKKDNPEIKQ